MHSDYVQVFRGAAIRSLSNAAAGTAWGGGRQEEIEVRLQSLLGSGLASLVLFATLGSQAASAAEAGSPTYSINYTATSLYPVSDITIFQSDPTSLTNSFSIGVGESTITNPFTVSSIPTGDFLLGVAADLSSDNGDGQQHLVLFGNDIFVDKAEGVAFGTLFPNTNESTLINDLEVIGQTVPGDTTTAYDDLFGFQSGDAINSPNGTVNFATGSPFEEIAFSNGQIIGSGISYATQVSSVSAAPEPSTWLLMFAGLGGVGLMLRRAKWTTSFRFKDAISA